MTLIENLKKRITTPLIKKVAALEGVPAATIADGVVRGTIVVPQNRLHRLRKPCAIGEGLSTKVNVNIGTSVDCSNIDFELEKLRLAESLGANAIMDLSTSKNLQNVRRAVFAKSSLPLGTVPVYEIAVLGTRKYGSIDRIPENFFIETLELQAREGVDFFTIHAGITRDTVSALKRSKRSMGIVSRGGAVLLEWMTENSKENPFYSLFDDVLDIAKEFDVTLSLGDGMRPGAITDATDDPQIGELLVLGELQKKAFQKGVQVMIEGPGHVPLNQVKTNVELEKAICNGAPFYVLGPVVTDIAPGYDHITSAIGGALAASYGADFLCYVTPAEHLRLPTIEDVKEGLIAAKIAAHAADIAKGVPGAIEKDRAISRARFSRNWEKQFKLALDPEKCASYRKSSSPKIKDVCTMCSEYCSLKISERYLKK